MWSTSHPGVVGTFRCFLDGDGRSIFAAVDQTLQEVASPCRSSKWPAQLPMQYDYKDGEFFYVRECYDEYYKLVEQKVLLAKAPIVTVTGSPGIGKSIFYGYVFERFRLEHPDVCLVATSFDDQRPRRVSVYKGHGHPEVVPVVDSSDASAAIRSAILKARDAQRDVVHLCDGVYDEPRACVVVVFTSPNEQHFKNVEKHEETYYMPLWTREELLEAARVLDLPIRRRSQHTVATTESEAAFQREDEREAEIMARFEVFGGDARRCLHLDPVAVLAAISSLDAVIDAIKDLATLTDLLEGKEMTAVRHRLLHYEPAEEGNMMRSTKLASSYVMNAVTRIILTKYRMDRKVLRSNLEGIPKAASLHGWIFEAETHEELGQGCKLKLRPLTRTTGTTECVKIAPSVPLDEFDKMELEMLTRGPYHKPKSDVWESIDAFYLRTMRAPLNANDVVQWNKKSRLYLFQVTVSLTHDVNVVEIISVLTELGLLESVAAHPERAALVFVVPRKLVRDFKAQKIVIPSTLGSSVVTSITGIANETGSVLGAYNIRTVDDLKATIKAYDQKEFEIQPEHTTSWKRAYRCGVNHGLASEGIQYAPVIANIPQYVCTWE